MSHRIWRFTMPVGPGVHEVRMPVQTRILRVSWWKNSVSIHAICEDHAPMVNHKFDVIGTDDVVPKPNWGNNFYPYLGSYEVGPYIWHVFYRGTL